MEPEQALAYLSQHKRGSRFITAEKQILYSGLKGKPANTGREYVYEKKLMTKADTKLLIAYSLKHCCLCDHSVFLCSVYC